MKTFGDHRAAGVTMLSVALALAACTSSSNASGTASPPAGTEASASPSASTISIRDLPDRDPALRTLAEVPARRGSWNVGTVDAVPGDLILLSDCTGGTLTLRADPVATIPIDCAAHAVTPAQNVIRLREATQVTIRIEAPDSVLWNLRVEQ